MNPFEQEIKNCFSATKVNVRYTKLETRYHQEEAEVTQDNVFLQKKKDSQNQLAVHFLIK